MPQRVPRDAMRCPQKRRIVDRNLELPLYQWLPTTNEGTATMNRDPSDVGTRRKHRRWAGIPGRLFLVCVALGTAIVVGLWLFGDQLSDGIWPYMDTGVANVATYLLIFFTAFWGVVWIVFFSGRTWRWRTSRSLVIILALAVPLTLFEPVFSGGLGIRGWRPRFWSSRPPIETGNGTANLIPQSEADFPQFLGPRRDGVINSVALDTDWDHHPPQRLWRQEIGPGWSGFATRNGFAVTMQQDGEHECVSCYRIDDGALVWNYAIPRRHENILGGVGPRATPTIDDGRVYSLGAVGDLSCLDGATGQLVWHVDLLELAGIPLVQKTNSRGEAYQVEQSNVMWGRAASPLVYQGKVIVPLSEKQTLVAVDARTGSPVWFGGTGQAPGYASAVTALIHGQDQIIIANENSVTGHDPSDGSELWNQSHPGSSSGDANTSQSTFVGNDRILLSKGYGLGGELIAIELAELPKERGGAVDQTSTRKLFQPRTLWRSARVLKTKLTNPVVRDGFAFALSSEVLECVSLDDGERRWRAPNRFGHGQILLVGDNILAHTEDGQLVLAEASPNEYRELGRIKTIDGVCWNTIAIYGDCVLVRSDREAACFRLPVLQVAGRPAVVAKTD